MATERGKMLNEKSGKVYGKMSKISDIENKTIR